MKIKSRIKTILAICVLALILVSFTGCSDMFNVAFGTKWSFRNYTNYDVTISDIKSEVGTSGSPKSFTLSYSESQDAYVMGDTIEYTYNFSSLVKVVQDGYTLKIVYRF